MASARRGRSAPRTALALLLAGILLASCGARLTDEEREAGIAALTGGGGGSTLGTTSGAETTDGGTTDGGTSGGGTAGGGTTGGVSSDGGTPGGGGGGQAAAVGGCPKGTLDDSDTGVTARELTVATIADVQGVQPGLFQSAWDAANAAASYINSQGGICGRQLKPLLLDGRTDSVANRAAMTEACDKALAVVGSVSAFDDGSAKPGQDCKIPDMTAVTTNPQKFSATNVFPIYPNGDKVIGTTSAKYIKSKYPDVIKKAGILWLNQSVTRGNAQRRIQGWESVGFDFVYRQETQLLEADYTRFVLDMRSQGVQYVTMVADFQNIVRLQKAMSQQGYVPKVRDWDSVAYDPEYIALGGPAAEGSFVFLNTALFEERSPEMQLYIQSLQRTKPGAKPDYFGLYAWSAYRLFQKLATGIGPELTREKLTAALKATTTWDGNGLHGPHQIGKKLPTVCNVYVQVKSGAFSRVDPGSGFRCDGSLHAITGSTE